MNADVPVSRKGYSKDAFLKHQHPNDCGPELQSFGPKLPLKIDRTGGFKKDTADTIVATQLYFECVHFARKIKSMGRQA